MRKAEREQKAERGKPHTAAREALENKHFGERCVRFFDAVEIGVQSTSRRSPQRARRACTT
jgi:hypothetical protein